MNLDGSLLSVFCFIYLVAKIFYVYILPILQNAAITRMVWSVKKRVVTVATGNRVITWTEPVHKDVTRGCMERNVTWVIWLSSFYFTLFRYGLSYKPFSTQDPIFKLHNTLTFKYQLANMVLDETLYKQVVKNIEKIILLMRIHQNHWSIIIK